MINMDLERQKPFGRSSPVAKIRLFSGFSQFGISKGGRTTFFLPGMPPAGRLSFSFFPTENVLFLYQKTGFSLENSLIKVTDCIIKVTDCTIIITDYTIKDTDYRIFQRKTGFATKGNEVFQTGKRKNLHIFPHSAIFAKVHDSRLMANYAGIPLRQYR